MKETNRCFAAAFKHSHYDNLDDYKEYLRLRDKCKEYFIKNLGIIENYRMFIKHYTLTNFEDFKIDATKYMNDCNIIMKYFGNLDLLGTIKRNISRYFPNMSIEEYCVEFKKMLDLQNFVKDKYNHEYDNFHKQVWRYWNKMNLITPMIGIIIDLLSYLNYVKKILGYECNFSDIHNFLVSYSQTSNKYDSIEDWLFNKHNCDLFKNYCVKNNIKCTKDNIRHWRDSHLYYSGFFDTPKIVWNKAKDFSNINNDVKEIIYKIGDDNCSEEDIIKIKVIANNENFNIFKNKKNIFKPVKISNVIIPNNSIKIEDMHLDGQFLNITENDLKEHNQRKLIKNSRIEKELSKIGENLLIIKFALVKNISIPFQVGITHSLANKDFTGPNDLNFFFKQRFYHS